jgi:hypothetical protein
LGYEFVGLDLGLSENASQCSDGQFTVKRDCCSDCAVCAFFSQDDVAAALSKLHESKTLQRTNGLGT